MDDVKASNANNKSTKKLRKLLRDNRQSLQVTAVEAYPEIDISVCDVILECLKRNLSKYDGEPAKELFLAWARPLVEQRAKRMPKIHELFFASVLEINEAAYEAFPRLTPHYQAPGVVAAISRMLPLFEGTTQSEFVEWVLPLAAQEALRYEFTEAVLSKHENKIKSAIRSALNNKSVIDAGISYEDLYQEIVLLIFNMAPRLALTGTTEAAARFTHLARKNTGYHIKARKVRQKIIEQRVFEGCHYLGVATLPEIELASMRAEELENLNF